MRYDPPMRFLVLALLICATPAPAHGWGAAMHAYVNWKARQDARQLGVRWDGLDLQAYLAAAPGPDIWYASEEAKIPVPSGIEEDWDYVRLMLAESRDLRELSFSLGYAGHITGDVQGHRKYLAAAGGSDVGHLMRDSAGAFVLFGAFEGYQHYSCPADLVLGWGLGTTRGVGSSPGTWDWPGFDAKMVDLMVRAARRWCTARPQKKHCDVKAETIRGLRDFMRSAVNSAAFALTFPGYYAEQGKAAANAKLVKTYDDKEFGAGKGPARFNLGLTLSVFETRDRLFLRHDMVQWIRASAAPKDQVQRLFDGPPPPGQAQREGWEVVTEQGGCAVGGRTTPPAAWLLLLGLMIRARRRGVPTRTAAAARSGDGARRGSPPAWAAP